MRKVEILLSASKRKNHVHNGKVKTSKMLPKEEKNRIKKNRSKQIDNNRLEVTLSSQYLN